MVQHTCWCSIDFLMLPIHLILKYIAICDLIVPMLIKALIQITVRSINYLRIVPSNVIRHHAVMASSEFMTSTEKRLATHSSITNCYNSRAELSCPYIDTP